MDIIMNPENLWEEHGAHFLDISKKKFTASINDLFIHENPGKILVEPLSPGKYRQHALVVSYRDNQGTKKNWLIQIVDPGKALAIQSERNGIQKFDAKIHPGIEIKTGAAGVIAYPHDKWEINLDELLAESRPDTEIERFIKYIFDLLSPWYQETRSEKVTFFDSYPMDGNQREILPEASKTLWEELKDCWPVYRGYIAADCNSDLYPADISGNGNDILTIDFTKTGAQHWAADFAHLERLLRLRIIQMLTDEKKEKATKLLEKILFLLDSHYWPDEKLLAKLKRNIKNKGVLKALSAIIQVRIQADRHFGKIVNNCDMQQNPPVFEEEYFMMTAFLQAGSLVGSEKAPQKTMKEFVLKSIEGILNGILYKKKAREFFYGYFYYEINGFERILIKKEKNSWCFPISGFKPGNIEIEEALYRSVDSLLPGDKDRKAFLNAGFSPPSVFYQQLFLYPDYPCIEIGGKKQYIIPIFVKLKVENEFTLHNGNSAETTYQWVKKIPLFENNKINGDPVECSQEILKKYAKKDKISSEFGLNVLDCTDIIVFRDKKDSTTQDEYEHEFLLLHRRDFSDNKSGWEYPKGGMEYHENINEGAIRELLEETGSDSIGDFRYGGSLGFQTPDVSKRLKDYDLLRVHGVTYLFSGEDDNITKFLEHEDPKIRSNEHNSFKWVPFKEINEKGSGFWLKENDYGPKFLQKWEDNKNSISLSTCRPISLAFQITESCDHRCRFCHRRDVPGKLGVEGIKRIIDMVAKRGILRLTFTGGEPLLLGKETLFEIIRYANSKYIHVCLSTTGTSKRDQLDAEDLIKLNTMLDHMLISVHCVENREIAGKLYDNVEDWETIMRKSGEILKWTNHPGNGNKINMEVCTVVTKCNIDHILDVGKWIFERNENAFWRVDEYYHNGSDEEKGRKGPDRNVFELKEEDFDKLTAKIKEKYPKKEDNGFLRFNTKKSRLAAPDVMITPEGTLVTSKDNKYEDAGGCEKLLTMKFNNRLPWKRYHRYCRSDWPWENFFS